MVIAAPAAIAALEASAALTALSGFSGQRSSLDKTVKKIFPISLKCMHSPAKTADSSASHKRRGLPSLHTSVHLIVHIFAQGGRINVKFSVYGLPTVPKSY